jgi:hypothetical protein
MKKLFAVVMVLTAASMVLLLAGPDSGHKVYWCHYPNGEWTGTPGGGSKVILLEIDKSAPGYQKTVAKHLGHSPLLGNGQPAEGESEAGTAAGCPSEGCGSSTYFDGEGWVPVQLESVGGKCVCPGNSPNAGKAPAGDCGAIG